MLVNPVNWASVQLNSAAEQHISSLTCLNRLTNESLCFVSELQVELVSIYRQAYMCINVFVNGGEQK